MSNKKVIATGEAIPDSALNSDELHPSWEIVVDNPAEHRILNRMTVRKEAEHDEE